MRKPSFTRALGVAVVSACVVCQLSVAWAGTPSAAESTTKTAIVKSAGVSLEYPAEWIVFAFTKREIKQQRRALAKANPRLAKDYIRQAQLESTMNTEFSAG